MMRALIAGLGFAAAAGTAVFAAGRIDLDTIAGRYSRTLSHEMVDGPAFTADNILEIVKVSPNAAYVRADLFFANGHTCRIYGIARVENEVLVYRTPDDPGEECVFTIQRTGGRILLGDDRSACRHIYCGARGSLDGAYFDARSRRNISYMKRLQASREYSEAIAEWKKSK